MYYATGVSGLSFFTFALVAAVTSWFVRAIGQREQLIWAARRIEPVFILSRNRETGEAVSLPKELDDLCFHVPHKELLATAGRVRQLLLDSGNQFMDQGL
ncbi:hypothetical protein RZS08_24835, partial [Arthrospira platensis SPKY1]|nr:hypothetical protein [Arthrospira platensis SPKY1]